MQFRTLVGIGMVLLIKQVESIIGHQWVQSSKELSGQAAMVFDIRASAYWWPVPKNLVQSIWTSKASLA